jgi:hypothetical protein
MILADNETKVDLLNNELSPLRSSNCYAIGQTIP